MASSRYDDYKIENDFSAFNGFQSLPYDEWDQDPAQTKQDFDEAVGKGVQAPHDAFVQAVAEDMDKAPVKNDYELLWQGLWESGGISVPRLLDYKIYFISFLGSSIPLLAIRVGNTLGGLGGMYVAGNNYSVFLGASISGTTATMTACKVLVHLTGSGHNTETDISISAIYGVI